MQADRSRLRPGETHMKKIVVGLVVSISLASAQRSEVGGFAGYGTFAVEEVSNRGFAMLGVQVCGLCSGTFSVFAEYVHWENAGKDAIVRVNAVDLAAGGLRIQGGKRIRPFVDLGLAGGQDRFVYSGGSGSHSIFGAAIGAGVAIPIGQRFYLRPQVRTYLMSGLHFGFGGGIGMGFRF
jgi:hypothetical protein